MQTAKDKKQVDNFDFITPDSGQATPLSMLPESPIKIFLAGSIEMGKAEKWQYKVAKQIASKYKGKKHLIFFSPARENGFKEGMQKGQIGWEQWWLAHSDYIFMYIQEDTKSPISLLEFGEWISSGKLYVAVGKKFYRRWNITETAKYWDRSQNIYGSRDALVDAFAEKLKADEDKVNDILMPM